MNTHPGFIQSAARLTSGKLFRIEWIWINTDQAVPMGVVRIEVTQPKGDSPVQQAFAVSFQRDFSVELDIGGLTGRIYREQLFDNEPRIKADLVDGDDGAPIKTCSWLARFSVSEGGSTNTLLGGYYAPTPFALGRANLPPGVQERLTLGPVDPKLFQQPDGPLS